MFSLRRLRNCLAMPSIICCAHDWISAARDYALSLACRRLGLSTHYGRGFDDLPPAVTDKFRAALVGRLDREELRHALDLVIQGLQAESDEVRTLATDVEPQLRVLMSDWND
jgi:hypothetical protein